MICRDSRDRLALALRRYASGRITNDDLEDVIVDWRDRGAVAVKEMAWTLYDDMFQHRATGKRAIVSEERRAVARWIVFLHSDREYLWPAYSFIQTEILWLENILTFGLWKRHRQRRWNQYIAAGHFASWPFVSVDDLKLAMQKPRLLTGYSRE